MAELLIGAIVPFLIGIANGPWRMTLCDSDARLPAVPAMVAMTERAISPSEADRSERRGCVERFQVDDGSRGSPGSCILATAYLVKAGAS